MYLPVKSDNFHYVPLSTAKRVKLGQFTAKSKEIVRTFTGREPDETPNSTDSNIPLSLGIPANTIGTIDGGSAHTRQEWVDIASLPTGLKIVLGLMLEYQKNDCF